MLTWQFAIALTTIVSVGLHLLLWTWRHRERELGLDALDEATQVQWFLDRVPVHEFRAWAQAAPIYECRLDGCDRRVGSLEFLRGDGHCRAHALRVVYTR